MAGSKLGLVVSPFFPIDQFLNHIVEVEDDGLVLIDHVLHLPLPLLLLPLQSLDLCLLTLDDSPIEPDLHPCIALAHLYICTADLLQE